MRNLIFQVYFFILLFQMPLALIAAVLEVGNGKPFNSVFSAVSFADDGDTIRIYGKISEDGMIKSGIIISKSIFLIGQGPGQTIIEGAETPEKSDRRIFSVMNSCVVYISNMTLRHGNVDGNGGAIENLGILYLENCVIENNRAKSGGGIRNGLYAKLYLEKCTIKNNIALLRGGGINHIGSVLKINNCSIENNQAYEEGGGLQIENSGAEISNSLIFNNILTADTLNSNGAGLFAGSSGSGFQLNLTNTTISSNKGKKSGKYLSCGGGIGIISAKGNITIDLINCTITRNDVYCGQAIQAYSYDDSALIHFNLLNCIIANGTNDNFFGYTQNGGKITFSRSYTILEDNSIVVSGQGNMNSTDAELENIADNGGPTQTHALKPTSPAIDAGSSNGAPLFDQRGASRNGKTDIGAFEYGGIISVPEIYSGKGLFKIRVNPVSGDVIITNPENMAFRLVLMNMLGQCLLNRDFTGDRQIIDMQPYRDGIYILSIYTKDGTLRLSQKIIIPD